MGMFINIGKADFEAIRKGEYVDKSMLIAFVNSRLGLYDKFICVTRARRFGKSMAAKMLNAYYDESVDASPLFADLKIASEPSYEQHRNKYPVIYLDVSGFTADINADKARVVNDINDALSKELQETYPKASINPSDKLSVQLWKVVQFTHKPFIMIIDEWDAILRELDDDHVKRKYVEWLRTLFKDSYTNTIFAGVYMTGILPMKQYNTESALNNFLEFSMVDPGPLAGYFGFTGDEVHVLCKRHKMDEMTIKQWYDGYQLGDVKEIYNPFAVMQAMIRGKFASYWTSTAAYESLKRYISMNYAGLKDAVIELLAGGEIRVDVNDFANDIHEVTNKNGVLTLLIHLGYLSYDQERQVVRIPNFEVQQEFERTIRDEKWGFVAKMLDTSEQLLADTIAGREEIVAKAIDYAHHDNTSILQYNDENSLACVLSLAFVAARRDYVMVREMPTGKGFADVVLVPRRHVDKPAIILELKYNRSADAAIEQIKEKRYSEALKEYAGEVVLVGINYNKETKRHECVIEREQIGQKTTTKTTAKTTTKTTAKTTAKILGILRSNPRVTYEEIGAKLGLTTDGVYYHTNKLRAQGIIRREGGTNGGIWIVMEM